ncbi:glycoside hydrolase family 17 protein [Hebeloma cylindrosporum]|uniref:glucan endo-1,3-beta-D-glucosidase n=1 Tax=Hebeloma cylindrosporum TaxID=76867 RepID=A0A0C3C510_HEBCY|nr:glycoside hydrolase family 17 protein [Hebeloma cylindrosporum h7]
MFTTLIAALLVLPALAKNHFAGITASNSIGGTGSYTCRTQAQWNQLANDAKAQGFGAIRILAFDCNALDLASSAAKAAGLQVMAGIYVSGTIAAGAAQIDADVQTFRAAYGKYGAERYIGLTIGNEVNDSAANIMAKVSGVRATLRGAGISTPVSTVHVWVTIRDNKPFCDGDFIGANAHAFFDGHQTSAQAGDFLSKIVYPALKQACPGKKIYITESGWPSRGGSFGVAVASVADERTAIEKLNCASRDNPSIPVFAFEYDDQLWKSNDNERSFGIFGKIPLNGGALDAC